jgi:hypothetical protein
LGIREDRAMRSRRWRLFSLESRLAPAVIQWDGGPTGNGADWHDPINWVGDLLPGELDAVVINPTGANPVIQVSNAASALTITASRALSINAGGTLTLGPGGSILAGVQLAGGMLDLQNGCELSWATIDGTGSLTIPTARDVKLSLCTINVPLQVNGHLTLVEDLTVNSAVAIANGGSIRVIGDSAPTILNVTGAINNSGLIELTSIDTEQLARIRLTDGVLTNEALGHIKATSGSGGARDIQLATSTAQFVNYGQLSVAADTTVSRLGSGQTLTNSGTIQIDSNRTLSVNMPTRIDGGAVTGGGHLTVSSITLNAKVTTALASLTLGGLSGTGEWTIPAGMTARTNANTNLQAAIINYGTMIIRGSCSLGAGYVSQPGSVLRIQGESGIGPASLQTTAAFTNQSVIELTSATSSNNATLVVGASPFVNKSGGTIKSLAGAGGTRTVNVQFAGSFSNQGAIALVDAGLTVSGQPLVNDGVIAIAAGTTLTTSSTVTNSATGIISGLGTLKSVGLNSAGVIAPGPTSGILTSNSATAISGKLAIDLDSISQFDQLRVLGTVALSGGLDVQLNYAAKVGDEFVVVDNDGTDAITGTFTDLPNGTQFSVNGATLEIDYQGGTGNDVALKVIAVGPPALSAAINVNDGSPQRSMVTAFYVTFSAPPSFPDGIAAGVTLERLTPGQPSDSVAVAITGGGTAFTVTFIDSVFAPGPTHSLIDGKYQLRLVASKILGSAGPLNGGVDVVLALHRLFGDSNGDGAVTAADFSAFRLAYGGGPSVFDFDGDGGTNASDFNQFRLRYGLAV